MLGDDIEILRAYILPSYSDEHFIEMSCGNSKFEILLEGMSELKVQTKVLPSECDTLKVLNIYINFIKAKREADLTEYWS